MATEMRSVKILFDCAVCSTRGESAGSGHILILTDDMLPDSTPIKICSTYGHDAMIEILAEIVRQHREMDRPDA